MPEGDMTCDYVLNPDDPSTWGGREVERGYLSPGTLNDDDVWLCPHEVEEGENLCIFHLPPDEKDDEVVRDALLDKLEQAQQADDRDEAQRLQQFIGARFGSLNLTEETLGGEQETTINLSYSRFAGMVLGRGLTAKPDINMSAALFAEGVYFGKAIFKGDTTFDGATFVESANFESAVFERRPASFHDVTFEKGGYFKETIFKHVSYFSGSEFKGPGIFRGAIFMQMVSFGNMMIGGALFEDLADFSNTVFHTAKFDGVTFENGANFRSDLSNFLLPISPFQGLADFRDVTARGEMDFRMFDGDRLVSAELSTFTDETRFDNAEMANNCNFEGTTFDVEATFTDADVEGAIFREAVLNKVDFTGADLREANLAGADLQGTTLETAMLSRANLSGADLRGAKLSATVLTDARINDSTKFLQPPVDDLPAKASLPAGLVRLFGGRPSIPVCGYDPIFVSPKEDAAGNLSVKDEDAEIELDKAKSVYRAIENLAGASSRSRLQSRAFIRRQDMLRYQYRTDARDGERLFNRVVSRLSAWRATVGRGIMLYGESPWRIVGWSLFTILGFAAVYPVGGWMRPTGGDPITWGQIVQAPLLFGNSIYYSTLTFTTLGFGDFRPVGLGRAFTTVETALGAILIALLVFVLGRRATR